MAALLQPKRRRHALATSFSSMDARTYSEIGSVQARTVLFCPLIFLRPFFFLCPLVFLRLLFDPALPNLPLLLS